MARPRGEQHLVAVLGFLVLLAAGLGPGVDLAEQRLRTRLVGELGRLEAATGGTLGLEELDLRRLGRVRLQGLSVRAGRDPATSPWLVVEELELRFGLSALLPGRGLLQRAEARGVSVRLDEEELGELALTLARRLFREREVAAAPTGRLPSFAVGLPETIVVHDLRFVAGATTATVFRIPLILLRDREQALTGVAELVANPGELPVFMRLAGRRAAGDGWLRAEADRPLRPEWLARLLGRAVSFRAVGLSPAGLVLEEPTLSVPCAHGRERMGQASSLTVRLRPGAGGGLELALRRPELQLERYPDQGTNYDDLVALVLPGERGQPTVLPGVRPGGGPRPTPWLDLLPPVTVTIQDGTIRHLRYRTDREPEAWVFQGLQAELHPVGEQLGVTLSWEPGPQRGRLAVEGALRPDGSLSFRLRPAQLDLAALQDGLGLPLDAGHATGDLRLSRRGSRLALAGNLALADVSFRWGLIAANPLAHLTTRMELDLQADLAAATLELKSLAATVGEVELAAWGRLSQRAAAIPYEVTVALGPIPCRDIPGSLPEGLAPVLAGLGLDGHLSLRVRAEGDLAADESPAVQIDGTAEGFRVVTEAGPDLTRLRGPFVQDILLESGRRAQISLDPRVPGFAAYDRISPYLRRAVISSEDVNFYRHKGLDFGQIEASLEKNLQEGRIARGGSTLTQQVVKNLFLSKDKTLSRKLQEAYLAWKLEQVVDKRRILEVYLNIIEWGPEVFGARMASRYYFDKEPGQLTLAEAAFLAAIIPNPVASARQVRRGEIPPPLFSRMQRILKRMRALEYISEEEYLRGRDRRPGLRPHPELVDAPEPLATSEPLLPRLRLAPRK
ncbi:MAG: monofunctional biosynthetic peptidoglycan transglycosylase [Myxococcota bacterium]|jgi:monofunctional biosynthetic peptidoglycan transglycosylase|nr:monofunctional biosynthetic peptidoglycan transglycosylase [Myxococcota bacterium]